MSFDIAQSKQRIADGASEVLGVDVDPDWVEFSNPKAGSHLALPCFRFAKDLGKSPNEIAEQVAKNIAGDGLAASQAQGPYVNFWLRSEDLAKNLAEQTDSLTANAASNGETVVVEFLSPNLAKPLSIGHLRNALQGRALALVYRNAGYDVITDNHVGDWGTVFGMWVVGFEKFSSDDQLEEGGIEELGRMYVEVRKALKAEADDGESTPLADGVQEWLLKLEQNDEQAWKYHKRFGEISLTSVSEQMAELDIAFDHNLGESFFVQRGKEMVEELVVSGSAVRNDDGSVVVPLEEQGVDTPMLIEKSNGAALYHTSDIATIEYREKEWHPSKIIYVVGAEQQFHFKQLFAANDKIGWTNAELIHHWYGLIEELDDVGKRQKMSSRKNAIFMSDLLRLAEDRARQIAPDDLGDEDIKRIALGALTFQEFSASHTGNTLFDWESMFSLSGFSGPYLQYAAVRINSVLSKFDGNIAVPDEYTWDSYSDLLWQLTKYPSVVEEATAQRELHRIAEFAYDLARAWNRFYENSPILSADSENDRMARLWLAQTIGAYLERSLELLGIKIPSRM